MEKPKDGTDVTNSHGYPVGHCQECRHIQVKAYFLDGLMYCIDCFPRVVALKQAVASLNPPDSHLFDPE